MARRKVTSKRTTVRKKKQPIKNVEVDDGGVDGEEGEHEPAHDPGAAAASGGGEAGAQEEKEAGGKEPAPYRNKKFRPVSGGGMPSVSLDVENVMAHARGAVAGCLFPTGIPSEEAHEVVQLLADTLVLKIGTALPEFTCDRVHYEVETLWLGVLGLAVPRGYNTMSVYETQQVHDSVQAGFQQEVKDMELKKQLVREAREAKRNAHN